MDTKIEMPLLDTWTTGHPGVTMSVAECGGLAAFNGLVGRSVFTGPTRAGKGTGPGVLPVAGFFSNPKR